MAVSGELAKKRLMKWGTEAHRLVITGTPRYDRLSRASFMFNKQKITRQLRVGMDKGIILLANQPITTMDVPGFINAHMDEREGYKLLMGVIEAVKELPDKKLVIKIHPGDRNEAFTRRIVAEAGMADEVVIVKKYDTFKLVSCCDVLLTCWSSVATEAILLGKPVILLNFTGRRDIHAYTDSSGSTMQALKSVYRPQDLVSAIRSVLQNQGTSDHLKESSHFISDIAYKTDGLASKRVANLVKELINKRKRNHWYES